MPWQCQVPPAIPPSKFPTHHVMRVTMPPSRPNGVAGEVGELTWSHGFLKHLVGFLLSIFFGKHDLILIRLFFGKHDLIFIGLFFCGKRRCMFLFYVTYISFRCWFWNMWKPLDLFEQIHNSFSLRSHQLILKKHPKSQKGMTGSTLRKKGPFINIQASIHKGNWRSWGVYNPSRIAGDGSRYVGRCIEARATLEAVRCLVSKNGNQTTLEKLKNHVFHSFIIMVQCKMFVF